MIIQLGNCGHFCGRRESLERALINDILSELIDVAVGTGAGMKEINGIRNDSKVFDLKNS